MSHLLIQQTALQIVFLVDSWAYGLNLITNKGEMLSHDFNQQSTGYLDLTALCLDAAEEFRLCLCACAGSVVAMLDAHESHSSLSVIVPGSKNPAYLAEQRRDQEATEDMKLLKKGVVLVHKGDEVAVVPMTISISFFHSHRHSFLCYHITLLMNVKFVEVSR